MRDEEALHKIINTFINYERPEVQNFRKAIELFKQDVPKVTETLRGIIEAQSKTNRKFIDKRSEFHEMCKEAINLLITVDDINEMMIQHILTADIFNTIFDEPYFHRENNIAKELEKVLETFFTGNTRKVALGTIQHYYQTMNASAAGIADHHEKQKFLKVVYETFYKSYNPKAADRLGVVYTPNEIVRFMIESTDYLLHSHFNKFLEDKHVEILDPATGTGTYICELIDYLRPNKLEYKYKNEIHANEIAILPYYIANLNIEFTYKQKMAAYAEFESLCFVDTLDNMGFGFTGKQTSIFSVSAENSTRIKRQNEKKISVIIGNPPYNANQANENDNNKNRVYQEIDKRIKDSFIKYSTAQKTKVYDMYARFYRWAFDRLGDNGVITFITNRSFIESRTFDGFRKVVASEFDYVYIIDLGGDVRANPKLSGTRHNVFGIQTGVAIMFLIKLSGPIEASTEAEFKTLEKEFSLVEEPVIIYGGKEYLSTKGCEIFYVRRPEFDTKDEKLQFLASTKFKALEFERIRPDKNNNWINLADNDFENLLPLASKDVKLGRSKNAIFELFSLGVVTNRDEWVHDIKETHLHRKVKYLITSYNNDRVKLRGYTQFEIRNSVNYSIKWTRAVLNDLFKDKVYKFDNNATIDTLYRPYVKRKLYYTKELNEMRYQMPSIIPSNKSKNSIIGFLQGERQAFSTFATNLIPNLAMFSADYAQCIPLY
jgi:predicted helicase